MATQTRDTAGQEQGQPPREYGGFETTRGIDGRVRAAAGVLGAILLVRGFRRRGLRGTVTALAGAWLVARALGHTPGEWTVGAVSETLAGVAGRPSERPSTTVSRSIVVDAPADDLGETWRDPDQLAQIVGHAAEVTATDDDIRRFTVEAPGGRTLSWDARIVEAEPGEYLRWETPGDAAISHEGELRFSTAPAGRGTEVELTIDVRPPGGAAGAAAIDRLAAVPESAVGTALDRFKSLAETGEVPTLEGNPSARGRGDLV